MRLSVYNVTPALMVKNEDYWIHYVLRDLFKVFPQVMLLDTGSTDRTKEIALATVNGTGSTLLLIEENYGSDANKIGNGRNIMRQNCATHWMFLIDGDEIWREDKLQNVLSYDVDEAVDVIMVAGWNVQDVDGQLMLRTHDLANRDGLFSPRVAWTKLDYPFEGYGLQENYLSKGVGTYLPATECYAWHMRHTLRSSKNWDTYFRRDKLGYYPYGHKPNQTFEPMPENWLGEVNPAWPNPYLGV